MRRYYFHVYHNDDGSIDTEGVELRSDAAAWSEATSSCGQMIRDLDGSLRVDSSWRMDVADASGTILFRLSLRAEHGPGLTAENLRSADPG